MKDHIYARFAPTFCCTFVLLLMLAGAMWIAGCTATVHIAPDWAPRGGDEVEGSKPAPPTASSCDSAADGYISVVEFGAKGDCKTDDTAAITRALQCFVPSRDRFVSGGVLFFPAGVYRITSQIRVTDRVALVGLGSTLHYAAQGPSVILKDGSFDGILLQGSGAALRDIQVDGVTDAAKPCRWVGNQWVWANGGDGVVLEGIGTRLQNVAVTNQKGDGVRVGGKAPITTTNTNIWRITDLVVANNGGNGLHVSHAVPPEEPGIRTRNANGGILVGLRADSNRGEGLRIEKALDNQFFGVLAEFNGECGIHLVSDSGMAGAEENTIFMPYTECNGWNKNDACHNVPNICDIAIDMGTMNNVVISSRPTGYITHTVDLTSTSPANVIIGRYDADIIWEVYGKVWDKSKHCDCSYPEGCRCTQ